MVQSPDDPNFMIQERFTSLEDSSCTQSSVSTGMVRIEGDAPKIQISTPRTGQSSLITLDNQCPIDFYVNGVASEFPAGDEQGKTYDNNGNSFDGYVEGPGYVFIGVWGNWISMYNTGEYTLSLYTQNPSFPLLVSTRTSIQKHGTVVAYKLKQAKDLDAILQSVTMWLLDKTRTSLVFLGNAIMTRE